MKGQVMIMDKRFYFIWLIFLSNFTYADQPVDFYYSLESTLAESQKTFNKHIYWEKLRKLYDKYYKPTTSTLQNLKIPKIIHQIWLGPNPLPEKHARFRKSWQLVHPDWNYYLWTDKEAATFKLINQKAFDTATNWGEKSDILRYEILYRYGGLYVDDDFECLKSFEPLHYMCEFYTGLASTNEPVMYNGLIGAVPQHPIMKQCIETVQLATAQNTTFASIIDRTGPLHMTRVVMSLLPELKSHPIIVFPPTFFYAWPHYDRDHPENVVTWLRPESIALHHWAVSWNNGKTE